jgi:hypothetical protein
MKLQALRQGNKTVNKYTIEFNLLRDQTGMANENKHTIEQYIQGLDSVITLQIFNNTTLPSTLNEWQKIARNINHNRQKEKELVLAFEHRLEILNKSSSNNATA